jgi:hypothetical protein
MFEVLPRLLLLLETVPQSTPILLMTAPFVDSVVSLLTELKVLDASRVVRLVGPPKVHFVTNAFFVSEGWYCDQRTAFSREMLTRVRDKLGSKGADGSASGSIVVIKEASKPLDNAADLLAQLQAAYKQRAVEFVFASNSMRDVASLFATAKAVVTTESTAFALAFCAPGTAVIHLATHASKEAPVSSAMYRVATSLGLKYHMVWSATGSVPVEAVRAALSKAAV